MCMPDQLPRRKMRQQLIQPAAAHNLGYLNEKAFLQCLGSAELYWMRWSLRPYSCLVDWSSASVSDSFSLSLLSSVWLVVFSSWSWVFSVLAFSKALAKVISFCTEGQNKHSNIQYQLQEQEVSWYEIKQQNVELTSHLDLSFQFLL